MSSSSASLPASLELSIVQPKLTPVNSPSLASPHERLARSLDSAGFIGIFEFTPFSPSMPESMPTNSVSELFKLSMGIGWEAFKPKSHRLCLSLFLLIRTFE